MALTMQDYVINNDLEGAISRLNTTTLRWYEKWFEVCKEIYNASKKWAKLYILDPIAKTIKKLVALPKTKKPGIDVAEGCSLETAGTEKCYLIEFFDENDNSICSKVGTTTRTVLERIREELNSKTYKSMGAVRCVIHRIYDCGNIPAEGLESYFRAKYIRKYPESFKKNDRFINEKFDLKEADCIFSEYFAQLFIRQIQQRICRILFIMLKIKNLQKTS